MKTFAGLGAAAALVTLLGACHDATVAPQTYDKGAGLQKDGLQEGESAALARFFPCGGPQCHDSFGGQHDHEVHLYEADERLPARMADAPRSLGTLERRIRQEGCRQEGNDANSPRDR
jgi:hypothetical protein